MRAIVYLTLVSCALLAGCDQGQNAKSASSDGGGTASAEAPISLEPADLEKLSSWAETSKANAKLTKKLADIMADVKDEASAEAAIAKLKDLAPKFAAVDRAEDTFGEPSKDDRTLVLKNLASANKAFDQSYSKLIENEELKAIVGQAIDDAYVGNVTE